jgi:uncharacterized repeat protein (TIGR03803 family)
MKLAISTWNSLIRAAGPKIADWLGQPDADPVAYNGGGFADTALPAAVPPARHPALTTLVSFGGPDGSRPDCGLIFDATGDLFGTTAYGGPAGVGTVFELADTGSGYAGVPTTLASFTGANGKTPAGGLVADAAGDLFGVTEFQSGGGGTVFEIVKTSDGYASTPTTLVSFTGGDGKLPSGGLIADAAGDLFGVTRGGGSSSYGTVFEIIKTPEGYASKPTALVSFNISDGETPVGGLVADGAGDLFGTTQSGGANGNGTVFEVAKTQGGYANVPTTLVNFDYTDGGSPLGSLVMDAAGDLFGTTYGGGASGDGTVFEVVKTSQGYSSTPTTLVSFNDVNGVRPYAGLIIDAAGNLFGTTLSTVYEIAKTDTGYASAPTILATFTGANGGLAEGPLIVDAAGDLFGTTTKGGKHNVGTVFEITHSGYVVSPPTAIFAQAIASHGASGSVSTSVAALATPNEAPTLISTPRAA